jgi:hypothetical protein
LEQKEGFVLWVIYHEIVLILVLVLRTQIVDDIPMTVLDEIKIKVHANNR